MILDGYGLNDKTDGNAVAEAKTPVMDNLMKTCPFVKGNASGMAVGLPDGQMGNSEVGHLNMGAGRIVYQELTRITKEIEDGVFFENEALMQAMENCKKNSSTLHFIGLLSDGNVHSHIDHLKAMVKEAKQEGVKKVRIHALLDGRDVGEMSALDYFDPFVAYLESLNDASFDAQIASGGGRMVITMDRYNANWDMVRKGWETHVLGEGRQFASAHEAIETLRAETGAIDQDLPPFVIAKDGKPVGTIEDNDSVILFNFRGDRALEITKAFEAEDLKEFDRKRKPNVEYAGMMEYDGDLHVPAQYLVSPPSIDRTMAEYLCATGLKQFSISETQKFGHVTYFFNGNKTGKFNEELEEYVEIPSDIVPFEERPWMKCAEIADRVIKEVESGKWDLIKLNFPNGDMVGHTGVFEAVVCSMEAMDLQIGRIWDAIKKAGGVMVVTADHGNADDMYEHGKDGSLKLKKDGEPKSKTSHSLNPVPCIICDSAYNGEYSKELKSGLGISSIPATLMNLLGYDAPEDYDPSVITLN